MLPFVRVASAWSNTAPFSFCLTFSHISSVTHLKTVQPIYINFFSLRHLPVCYAIKNILCLLHNLKNCCNLCTIKFLPIPIYLFFYFVLPGITRPGWSALLPAAPFIFERR